MVAAVTDVQLAEIEPSVADRLDRLTATVIINGNTIAQTGTHEMQLYPGELLSTGTLPGVSGTELGR